LRSIWFTPQILAHFFHPKPFSLSLTAKKVEKVPISRVSITSKGRGDFINHAGSQPIHTKEERKIWARG
jgi:hypothetical protein